MAGLATGPWDLEPVAVDWVSATGLPEEREIRLDDQDKAGPSALDEDKVDATETEPKGLRPFVVELAALAYVGVGIMIAILLASVVS